MATAGSRGNLPDLLFQAFCVTCGTSAAWNPIQANGPNIAVRAALFDTKIRDLRLAASTTRQRGFSS